MEQCEEVRELREKLERYEKAEKDGRLLWVPCKVGDKVYLPRGFHGFHERWEWVRIFESKVNEFVTDATGKLWMVYYVGHTRYTERVADFGKTWFLKREEADAAVEKINADFKASENHIAWR